jgi:ATP-dependent protease Clp ATPase subunit
MNERTAFERGTATRHLKSIDDQLHRHSRRDCPAEDPARKFILKNSQVTKASATA